MQKQIVLWLGREFVFLSCEGVGMGTAADQMEGIFARIRTELQKENLSLDQTGLHPPNWTKYVRVVGRIIPPGKKGSCHEATAEVQPRVQTSSC